MQARPVGQRGVDEGRGEIHAATRGLEHALDEVADAVGGEDGRRQLADAVPGHEHLARFVDPDLLDQGVVEVGLERTEAGHLVDEALGGDVDVLQRRQTGRDRALLVVVDGPVHERTDAGTVCHGIDAVASDRLSDLCLEGRAHLHHHSLLRVPRM